MLDRLARGLGGPMLEIDFMRMQPNRLRRFVIARLKQNGQLSRDTKHRSQSKQKFDFSHILVNTGFAVDPLPPE